MASSPKSRLDRAMKQAPPRKKPSELDQPEVRAVLRTYLQAKADGAGYGSLAWLHASVLVPDFGVETSVGNLRTYLGSHFPDLYAKAMRGGKA